MSEDEKLDETSIEATIEPVPEEPALEETTPEETAPEETQPDTRRGRGSGGIAWLALLIALIAAAGIGYSFVDDWRSSRDEADSGLSLAELEGQLGNTRQTVAELGDGLSALGDTDGTLSSRLDTVERDIDARVRLFESLPARMSTIEQSIASLQGLSTGAKNTLLLAEAEYYMQIANAQLQLAGNPDLAAMALRMADDRIVQLADPSLTDVRRALANELALLDGMEKPDIEGITLTLASLSRVVDSMPLRRIDEEEVEAAVIDAGASGAARAWSSVKGAFAGLVRVRKTDETDQALIAPDAEFFLRANLSLQMQAARLALLRGEKSIFEQSLDDADAWIERYFDLDDAQVSSARDTIAEIRDGLFAAVAPDISESLRLLRQQQAITDAMQTTEPVEPIE
ncbi:MAG: uroporphyrinogen-III C-methyltransferase [Woeseiaceae bacterium]|nr:uroporphyrinogen-III C-methyltransferase [Woeseiaceae bacterium]